MGYKLHKVIRLEVIGPYKLRASFEDGTCQEADLRPILSGRIYSPLKDLKLFNQVYLDDGVPTWPTGADFSPNMLHDWPERLPALLKKAEDWRRGFELTPSEERPPILFDWDEINELVEGKVEEYRKKLPYLYNSIGRIELDLEVAKQLYAMVPHPHLQRRIKALEESLQQTRESLDSRLEKFGDEVAERLAQYCNTIKENMKEDWQGIEEDLQGIEAQLRNSKGEWQWHVALIITQIPFGHLATYGCIGNVANQLFGHNLIPRNVAWLRNRLYEELTHDTPVPLHRLAKVGDVQSRADSKETRRCNNRLRGREGSLTNPIWWDPSPEGLRRLKLALIKSKEGETALMRAESGGHQEMADFLRVARYIQLAMRHATFEILDDQTFYGEIVGFQGVYANAETLEQCREELQSVLEGWITLGLKMNHLLPEVDGVRLEGVPESV